MKTVFRRTPFSYIPGYSNNAVIQLIIASGIIYVIFHFIRAVMMMAGPGLEAFMADIVPNVALPALLHFKTKVWTIFTYGWFHMGFWELVSNMLWLYCFGNLVQILVGYKQVIPLFAYSLITGGVFYILAQLIPGSAFAGESYLVGCQAGLMGMAVAAITLAPTYRFFLGPTLSIPLMLVAGIFALLMLMNTHLQLPLVFLLLGGGLTGFAYIRLLRSGYRPGEWIYTMFDRMERIVTPNERTIWEKHNKKRKEVLKQVYEPKQGITQKRIDDILDKINQKGYDSLTAEEKDILFRAGKEK